MKIRLAFGFVVLATTLGLWYFFNEDTPESTPQKQVTRRERGDKKKKELLQQTRSDLAPNKISQAKTSIPKDCIDFESNIIGWTSKELREGRYDLSDTSHCFENKNIQKLAKEFLKTCQTSFSTATDLSDSKEDPAFETCLENFFMLRAWIVSQAYKNISPSAQSDARLVIDRLLAALQERDFLTMIEAADQLVRLEPDLYEAHKSRVTARFIQSHMGKEANPDWQTLDEIVKELQAFDIEDPELLDVVMMVKSRALSDREALAALTQELFENPETKSYGLYLQAASLHESGAAWTPSEVEAALTRVNEALRLSPSEKRFLETRDNLEKIKKDLAAGKSSQAGPFIFNFGFSFDLN